MYNVLVVDDDMGIRNLLESLVQAVYGFNAVVKKAINGQEALGMFCQETDLVLIDNVMGYHGEGLETIVKMRQAEKANGHRCAIFLVSGTVKDESEVKLSGADELICKPFDCYVLEGMMLKYLPNQ